LITNKEYGRRKTRSNPGFSLKVVFKEIEVPQKFFITSSQSIGMIKAI